MLLARSSILSFISRGQNPLTHVVSMSVSAFLGTASSQHRYRFLHLPPNRSFDHSLSFPLSTISDNTLETDLAGERPSSGDSFVIVDAANCYCECQKWHPSNDHHPNRHDRKGHHPRLRPSRTFQGSPLRLRSFRSHPLHAHHVHQVNISPGHQVT
ncbi:hypothetical protein EDB84DRAFT_416286 [Lactarius hengduanensis]|nr:hypothetical protein EDB84DRAFT_416286 [Lactarius hengduanensis]